MRMDPASKDTRVSLRDPYQTAVRVSVSPQLPRRAEPPQASACPQTQTFLFTYTEMFVFIYRRAAEPMFNTRAAWKCKLLALASGNRRGDGGNHVNNLHSLFFFSAIWSPSISAAHIRSTDKSYSAATGSSICYFRHVNTAESHHRPHRQLDLSGF